MAFHKANKLQEAEKSVAQGKVAQAIKLYQEILDNDPSDVSLLNTVGDLYIRDRNITEGLRQFHRLAEAYVREGFNVKAIAIYRKISKVDPNSIDTLLKLGELYQLQGLSREAREQYLQAVEFFKKRNQTERVLDVLHKLVLLDPENINFRNRLATECEQAGKREDAARTHLESAEILLRRDDQAAAETALKKAAELDPKNSKIQILRARVAIARQQPEEAERIIKASPELQSDLTAKRILLDAYLATRKLPEAETLVLEVFKSNPSDFAPVSGVSALLVEKGDIEEAYKLLAGFADQMINQNNAGPLLEAFRRVWTKAPKHIPTLELVHRICERTADEYTLPEVLEALGRAYEEAGNLEKAEAAYLRLSDREPENENYRGLLNAVKKKLGRELKPVDFSSREMALGTQEEEEEHPPKPADADAAEESMVKEALENGDLFSRYNLPEKAIGELEKVLQVYPDQIDIHRRILEISHKGFPERAAVAAAQLARIFAAQGDTETAEKYQAVALAKGAVHELPRAAPPPRKKVEEPAPPPPSPPAKPEAGVSAEIPIEPLAPSEPVAAVPAPPPAAAPPPTEFTFDLTPLEIPIEPPAAPTPSPVVGEEAMELDLSGDLDAMAAFGFEAPAPSFAEPKAVAPPPVETPAPVEIAATLEEPAAEALGIPVAHEELAAEVLEIPVIPEEAAPETVETSAHSEAPSPAPVMDEATPPVEKPAEVHEPPPEFAEEAIPVDLEDSRIEVEFYLENGFIDEARQTVATMEAKYPGSPFVAELRRLLNERTGEAPPAEPQEQVASQVAPADEVVAGEPPADYEIAEELNFEELPVEVAEAEPEVASPSEPAPAVKEPAPAVPQPAPVAEEPAHEEWELPTSYAVTLEPEPAVDHGAPHPVKKPEAPPPAHEPEPVAAQSGGMDVFGDFAQDMASTLDGMAVPEGAAAATPAASPRIAAASPTGPQGASQLSGLLAEMEDSGGGAGNKDDPETHYNLGVAFREMDCWTKRLASFKSL
jgi:tetratricopeptide (TPR) repeat protein